ncbi:piggyBac transposable element-derived protein 4-like isoform X1 [Myotis daubentonii]|uniref:piggyBac transposable element-derived protein 4-like isoform X1 n=1 Tax=Myotis daubentonii TaxID=98922 RepID=UPI002872CCD0|nr:piggyBac transposable element-derived protein 4-like isoform X1 [Myotis daubentonii]XP_059531353.1 piggyBac transposable element-derived protein 4-like isoform X1 [Myotis daubentonii]
MDSDEEHDKILDIFADNLSDIPSESDESFDSGNDTVTPSKRQTIVISSDSEPENLNNSTHDFECNLRLGCQDNDWSKEDFQPNLEKFEGNSGVTVLPSDCKNIIEVTNLIFDNDLFELFCHQSNIYYNQNLGKHKISKTKKWSPVTPTDMKKFLGLIVLMGRTRKDTWKEYWSTNPALAVPIFPQTMTRNRFEQIWTYWHFNDNANLTKSSSRLFKIQSVLDHFISKFQTIYKPMRELSLDEGMIPWRGRLLFQTYNPAKIIKYGLLVRMVCESKTGYICNMEIYTGEGKKLNDSLLSLLRPYLDLGHHIYQGKYYGSISIAETLLLHKTRVCGTIRTRGLPKCLKDEASTLQRGKIAFRRKGDVLLLIWKGKREVRIISTIHDASSCETEKTNWHTGEEIKKPVSIVQYNNYVQGVDLAGQYLSTCSILRKPIKWTKKVVLYLINCGLFNSFRIYQALNPGSRVRYKDFLLTVATEWISSEVDKSADPEFSNPDPSRVRSTRAPQKDHPQRLSGNMKQHIPVPIPSSNKKKYPTKVCRVCKRNGKRRETRYICQLCLVPLHITQCFTKYHTLRRY